MYIREYSGLTSFIIHPFSIIYIYLYSLDISDIFLDDFYGLKLLQIGLPVNKVSFNTSRFFP